MAENDYKRYRVSIPLDDASAIEWAQKQHCFSISIRQLIRAAIEVNGMRDYFASGEGEITQKPKRGRPPKVTEMTEEVAEEVVEAAEEVPEPVENTPVAPIAPKPASESVQDRIARMQGLLNQ